MGSKTCPTPDKFAYGSRDAARKGKRRRHGERMTPYKCPCGQWHLRTWYRDQRLRMEWR